MSELGGAHLHEGILEALTWELQVPKIKKTISLNMTGLHGFKDENSYRFFCYDWLAMVSKPR